MPRPFQTQLRPKVGIQLAPFLGLALLLVIALLLVMSGLTEAGGNAETTTAASLKVAAAADTTAVEVVLDDQDRIRFQNETITHGMLAAKLHFLAGVKPDATVLVRAGRKRSYGDVVELVATIRAAGLKNIALETVPEVIPLPDLPPP